MKDTVRISYGNENIFGTVFDAVVDFRLMTLSAEGKTYRIELESKSKMKASPTTPVAEGVRSFGIELAEELNKSIIVHYKKWLKEQDPVTSLMQEMGYYSPIHEAARKILDV